MKNIKCIYWILTGIFFLITIGVIFFTNNGSLVEDKNWTNTLLTGVAICLSIIAMGLSDKKINAFNGEVHIWKVEKSKSNDLENGHYHISMKIINKSETETVTDFVYRLRLPSKISNRILDKNSSAKEYKHGYSKIIIDDTFGFLGVTKDENFIPIDLRLKLDEWISGNIFISVNGSNISTTTFKLTPHQVASLKSSNNSKPIKATKI